LPENTDVSTEPGSSHPAPAAIANHYTINPMVSRFAVQAFATGMLSAFGHNPKIAIRDLKGEIQFDPAHIDASSMHLVIRADSLSVTDKISDKDRRDIESDMRDKVLETAKYPEIVFDVSNVIVNQADNGQSSVTLNGQLTLHGVTKPQKVAATLVPTGDMLRAFGELSLRQSDYGIKPTSAVGGALKVKDEVKFTFDIVARKQDRGRVVCSQETR
jgi:polyisoprenoid-binding protein YceI